VATRGRGGYSSGRGRGRGRGGGAPSPGHVADARQAIIRKQRAEMKDAREKLVSLAKRGGDARQKLEKIRNLREGKLEVKKSGSVTVTRTTSGQLVLTTRKKEAATAKKRAAVAKPGTAAVAAAAAAAATSTRPKGTLTRRVGRGGTLSISTKKSGTVIKPEKKVKKTPPARAAGVGRRASAAPVKSGPLTRTIKGELSEAARLDEELLNTHVDPVVLKRTIKQPTGARLDSPPHYVPTRTMGDAYDRRRDRSRSPMDYDGASRGGRRSGAYNDYDDPGRRMDDDEVYRRKIDSAPTRHKPPTMGDRLDGGNSRGAFVSPLQGAKIQVANLNDSVSQEDISELFGDVGSLKRAKLVAQGVAEVVFFNMADAVKAVEIYHNRQLDGKPMKCVVVTGKEKRASSPSRSSRDPPPPEMSAVHRALFKSGGGGGGSSERSSPRTDARSSRPMFSASRKSSRR